jgi:chromosome segregation ATPase
MPDEVITSASQPEATAVPSAASRMAALQAKIEASQPQDQTGEGSSTVDESEEAGQEAEVETEPAAPKAKAKAAQASKVRPLGGKAAAEDDVDAEPETDIDRIAALERNVRKEARASQAREQQFQSQLAQFHRERQQFDQERQQLHAMRTQLATPEGILEWFEQNNGTGEKLGEYIVQANDPTKRAAQEAKRALTPIEQELAAIKQEFARMHAERATAQAETQLKGRLSELASSDEHADDVQHSAAVMNSDPEYFVQAANAACDQLAATRVDAFGNALPFDFDDVILELEKKFAREASRYTARQTTGEATATQARSKPAPKLSAKAPAKLVNQRVASGRTMLAVEEQPEMLSLKERGARLERKLMGRQG